MTRTERKIFRMKRQLAALAARAERERDKEKRDAAKRKAAEASTLNPNERALLRYVVRHSPFTCSVTDIADACYYRKGARSRLQASSWARNSARKPLREGLIQRVGRGSYRATHKGRRLLAKGGR